MANESLILNDNRPLMTRLREFISCVGEKIDLEKVLLFGSTAKGTRHLESDVDLIVFSESFRDMPELERSGMLLDMRFYVEELQIFNLYIGRIQASKKRIHGCRRYLITPPI